MKSRKCSYLIILAVILSFGILPSTQAQEIRSLDRKRAHSMLSSITRDLKKHYYDPALRGVDMEARIQAADEMIERATTLDQAFGVIAWTLDGLNDSHTFFVPPPRALKHEFGWTMQMVENRCLVTAVKPGSDAEAKGLKPGVVILSINGVEVVRESLWKLRYLINVLAPQPALRLVVQSRDEKPQTIEVIAKVRQTKRTLRCAQTFGDCMQEIRNAQSARRRFRQKFIEMGQELLIWKMPTFVLSKQAVDGGIKKARKHQALILDLRGNSGGFQVPMLRLVSNLFDHDIKVGDVQSRKETEPLDAKTRGKRSFDGTLIVLVDSESASASELVARVIQLEKRGTVMGDRTAGAVMQSKFHPYTLGLDRIIFYGAAITSADIIMTDGKSLEHAGVLPDDLMVPTPSDLENLRDPVLARAAQLLGVRLTPEEAGKLFPVEWKD